MALDFPANPINGQAYGSYIYNSTVGAWQSKEDPATVATVSTTAPASANPGDLWYDSDDGTSYMYYDDGTSAQWVELLSSGLPLLNTKADLAGASFTGNVTAPRFISTQATGTAPLTVASTTAVTNLNADLLDGQHASSFSPIAGSSSITTVGTVTSGTWNASAISISKGGTGSSTGSGLIPIIPSSITVGAGTASVDAAGKITFTNARIISPNACFNATYTNYIVHYNITSASSDNGLIVQMRNGSSVDTSANYRAAYREQLDGGATTNSGGNLLNSIRVGRYATSGGMGEITFFSPFDSANGTRAIGQSFDTAYFGQGAGWIQTAASHDSFCFNNHASITITGTMRIFGVMN